VKELVAVGAGAAVMMGALISAYVQQWLHQFSFLIEKVRLNLRVHDVLNFGGGSIEQGDDGSVDESGEDDGAGHRRWDVHQDLDLHGRSSPRRHRRNWSLRCAQEVIQW